MDRYLAPEDIDRHFDSLLYNGMPAESAYAVESARRAAHEEFTRQLIASALSFPEPEYRSLPGDVPYRRIF